MRFRLPQKEFLRLFNIAKDVACDEKHPIPIFTKVRIDAKGDGTIFFEAHSGEATIFLSTRGDVITPGGIAAPRSLGERIRHMPEGLLDFSTENSHIDLAHHTEKRRFRVFGLPTQDWPVTNKRPDGPEQKVPVAALRLLIEGVENAVSTDETKPGTSSLMLQMRGNAVGGSHVDSVGVDGHRMLTQRRMLAVEGTRDLLIRRGNLRAMKAMLDMATAAELPEIVMVPGPNHVALVVANATYVVRLTDERFPPYEQAVPGSWVRRFRLERAKLLDAIDGAMLVNRVSLTLQYKGDGKVLLSSDDVGHGGVEDSIEPSKVICDKGVDSAFKVKLSPRYLHDAVVAFSEEDVFFCPTDYGGVVMLAPGDEAVTTPTAAPHLAVIMSLRD